MLLYYLVIQMGLVCEINTETSSLLRYNNLKPQYSFRVDHMVLTRKQMTISLITLGTVWARSEDAQNYLNF